VSGVLSLAKPQRIKASHRRRWKGTTGHSVYIMNNPLAGTDPTGYLADGICLPGDPGCGDLMGQYKSISKMCELTCLGGSAKNNGKSDQKPKGTVEKISDWFSKTKAEIGSYFNGEHANAIQNEVRNGPLNDRARLAREGDVIGGSNANNLTTEKRDALRNLHNSAVVAEVGGKVLKEEGSDPLTYVGAGLKVLKVIAPLLIKVAKAEKVADEGNYVYRGLAKGEDAASGIVARAPGAGNSEISHIAGKRASEWISTTKDIRIATEKYGEHGVVRVDLNKVKSTVSDVSNGLPKGGRMSNWAAKDQEVLIRNSIPAEAITKVK
jgi:hypothetical protein